MIGSNKSLETFYAGFHTCKALTVYDNQDLLLHFVKIVSFEQFLRRNQM